MELIYIKMVLLLNSWLLTRGSPVAMLQHATSSQSIMFKQFQAPQSTSSITTTPAISSSDNQSKYEFKYEVSDYQTGDRKSHWEKRDGDNVRGVYTLYEPDGALRTVEYSADALHGFNAVVKRNEPNKHQHPVHNSGYNYKIPSGGDNKEGSNQGYKVDRDIFSSKGPTNHPEKINPHSPGVDFTVIHEQHSK